MRLIHLKDIGNLKFNHSVEPIPHELISRKEIQVGKIISDGTIEGSQVFDTEGNLIINAAGFTYSFDVKTMCPQIFIRFEDVTLEYKPSLTTTGKEAVYIFGNASPLFFRKYKLPMWLAKIYHFFHLLKRKNDVTLNDSFTFNTIKEHEEDWKIMESEPRLSKPIPYSITTKTEEKINKGAE